MKRRVLSSIAAVLFVAGCQGSAPAAPTATTAPAAKPAASTAAPAQPSAAPAPASASASPAASPQAGASAVPAASAQPAAASLAAPFLSPTSADQVDPNGFLRFVSTSGGNGFDPIKASSVSDNQYLFPIYDRLLFQNPNGSPAPMLATSWKFNDNPPSLDLTLRTDVKFHGGNAFDANVVKANIERAKGEGSLLATSLRPVTGVTVQDASHVRLILSGPTPDLPIILTDRPGIMADPAMFSSPDLATRGAGSGPFVVDTFRPGATTIYKRAPSYWDPAMTRLAQYEYRAIPNDDARLNAILTGQVEVFLILPSQLQRAKDAGLNIVSVPTTQTEHMKFNTSRSEFAKQEVRQAINYAIDRKTIVDTILENSCTVTSQLPPPGTIAHSDQVPDDYYAYNPTRAKQLLAQAGVPNGFTFTALVVNSDRYLPYAQAMQAQLAQIGVDMKLQPTPGSDIVDAFYVRKTGDAIISGDIAPAAPSQLALDNYLPNGTRNPGGQSTPEIEDLVQKVTTTADEQQRQAYWSQLTKAVTDYAFSVQICNRTISWGLTSKVKGFLPYVDGNTYFPYAWMAKTP